jgi:DNA-binding response OmpR family regulator
MSVTTAYRADATTYRADESGLAATLAAWPTELVTFAGLTIDPISRMLFLNGRAPIALSVDQTQALLLLMGRRGDFVPVEEIERHSVNTAATTVVSLNSLLRSADGLVTIVNDRSMEYRLVDSAAEVSLFFGDLRLNHVTRLLLVSHQAPVVLSPQNAAVLGLLMQARGGPVTSREVKRVSARTAPGAAIGNLSRRLKGTGTAVNIVNARSCGWSLVSPADV